MVKRHLQRNLYGGRTIAGKKTVTQHAAGECRQALGQLHSRRMGTTGQHHMRQGVELVLDGGIDARIGVAKQIDPPGADGVEVTLAVFVNQPHTLPAHDGQGRYLGGTLHLCAGVPNACQAACNQRSRHSKSDSGRNAAESAGAQAVRRVRASWYLAAVLAITSLGTRGAGGVLVQGLPSTRAASSQSRTNCLS